MRIQSFTEIQLREIAYLLDREVSHKLLTSVFRDCGLNEGRNTGNTNSKWQRIVVTLGDRQQQDGCGNNAAAFIEAVMNPLRFIGRHGHFDDLRHRLNELLAFVGLSVGEDGKLRETKQARTLSEAAERAGRLRKALNERRVHADVLKFCREELLQDNYFHAVFEATKSIADKIRQKAELATDGADLVDRAFSVGNPLLAINTLQSETEQSEQKGFANLLKGVFGTFRNVTAHAPKIKWPIEEQDALDLLTMVSYLHRRLDRSVKVPRAPSVHRLSTDGKPIAAPGSEG